MHTLHILRLTGHSILEQLRIEEALLRTDTRNWCIVNDGTDDAIVLGISGKVEKLICALQIQKRPIPLIRRFSGGGTVVVDRDTLFVTFIFNKAAVPMDCCYPYRIMKWSEELYRPVIQHTSFGLKENDYVIGSRKFGGNAQYLRKERWLHHSTLLWDYDEQKMNYLLLPEKRPDYRENRTHSEFLTPLSAHLSSRTQVIDSLMEQLKHRYRIHEVGLEEMGSTLQLPHRQSTRVESVEKERPSIGASEGAVNKFI